MMKKIFAQILLAALIGLAVSSPIEVNDDDDDAADTYSQAPFFPEDDGEVKNVPEDLKPLFSDFCVNARDEVKQYITTGMSEQSQKIVNVLMNSLHGLATEALSKKLESLSTKVQNNKDELDANKDGQVSAKELEDKIVKDLEDEDTDVQQPGLIKRFANSVVAALRMIARNVYGETLTYINEIRKEIGPNELVAKMEDACSEINYNVHMKVQALFQNHKSEVSKSASRSKNNDLVAQIKSLQLQGVQCVTTSRIITVQNACETFKNYASIIKMVTSKAG